MAYKRTNPSLNLYRIVMKNAHETYRESAQGLKEFAEGIKPSWDKAGKNVVRVDLVAAAEKPEAAEEESEEEPKKRGPGRPKKILEPGLDID